MIKHSNHINTEKNHKISLVLIKCAYLSLGKAFKLENVSQIRYVGTIPYLSFLIQWHLKSLIIGDQPTCTEHFLTARHATKCFCLHFLI